MKSFNISVSVPLTAVATEPIQNETVALSAGAAGTLTNFVFSKKPIADSQGSFIAGKGDTSVDISGATFTTEVHEKPDAELANGEFYINYITGKGRGRKADTATTFAADYSVFVPFVPPVE